MKRHFSRAFVFFCLLLAIITTTASSWGQTQKVVVYNTSPKLVTAKLNTGNSEEKAGEKDSYSVRGKATLTIVAANEDDTITGTLSFSLTDSARRKVAQLSGKTLDAIPANIIKRDVVAAFIPDTACPVVHLEIRKTELEIAGARATLDRLVLDIIETQDRIPQLFCAWTRQINAKRQHRGIVAAINRLISPEQ
jgi:hypothetical protein